MRAIAVLILVALAMLLTFGRGSVPASLATTGRPVGNAIGTESQGTFFNSSDEEIE
jgi:hypothetical protein